MLGLLGFLTMAIIILLLFKSKAVPSIAFIAVPTVMALIAGFSITEIGEFVKKGVADTAAMATLFIFSITFFGLMSDTGMFNRIISRLVKKAGHNVMAVSLLTTVIVIIASLDSSGASTFLITIPAMLPIFKKLNMRATSLMLITTTTMGVMNLLPWGGPTMRAASVINMDAALLWKSLIPIQFVGILISFAVAIIVAKLEMRRGAGFDPARMSVEVAAVAETSDLKDDFKRPKLFWFNISLTVAVISMLAFVKVPIFLPFMLGTAVALLVNYPDIKMQEKRVEAYSSAAILMASTLLSAGMMLGILQESGMMDAMGDALVSVIPAAFGPYIAIVIGIFSVPLALVFSTDSYYYGVMPIVLGVANSFGVDPVHVAVTMVACRNCACFVSPVVPATFLGCGLAGIEIGQHIKNAFLWVWVISLLMLLSGIVMGIIPLGIK